MTEQKFKPENKEEQRLVELIKDSKVAMMTTIHSNGQLTSRPMMAQQMDEQGQIWFFTSRESGKVDDLHKHPQVNISYSNVDDNQFVSIAGVARLVRDDAKIKELWNPLLKAWFPEGENDPDIALISVKPTIAEYWDTENSKLVQLLGFAKAIVTGQSYSPNGYHQVKL